MHVLSTGFVLFTQGDGYTGWIFASQQVIVITSIKFIQRPDMQYVHSTLTVITSWSHFQNFHPPLRCHTSTVSNPQTQRNKSFKHSPPLPVFLVGTWMTLRLLRDSHLLWEMNFLFWRSSETYVVEWSDDTEVSSTYNPILFLESVVSGSDQMSESEDKKTPPFTSLLPTGIRSIMSIDRTHLLFTIPLLSSEAPRSDCS